MEDIARGLLRIPLDTVGGSPGDLTTLDEATDKMDLFFIVQPSIRAVSWLLHLAKIARWPERRFFAHSFL